MTSAAEPAEPIDTVAADPAEPDAGSCLAFEHPNRKTTHTNNFFIVHFAFFAFFAFTSRSSLSLRILRVLRIHFTFFAFTSHSSHSLHILCEPGDERCGGFGVLREPIGEAGFVEEAFRDRGKATGEAAHLEKFCTWVIGREALRHLLVVLVAADLVAGLAQTTRRCR